MCVEEVNGYSCVCAAGYEGTMCQTEVNECTSNPCLQVGLYMFIHHDLISVFVIGLQLVINNCLGLADNQYLVKFLEIGMIVLYK